MSMHGAHDGGEPALGLDSFVNPLRLPGRSGTLGVLRAGAGRPLKMAVRPELIEIVPGHPGVAWIYSAEDKKNPVLVVRRGEDFSADITNELDEPTTTHWHGLLVEWSMDGHPSRVIEPGATYRYRFRVRDRSGTYWYHPHPHGRTAAQVAMGLAGLFLVDDEDDERLRNELGLILGETDIPLLLQDKSFDRDGNVLYAPDASAAVMGYEGETILVNYTPKPVLEAASRLYRLRLLNGANARIFRLALTDAGSRRRLPMTLIGTDGGLLEQSQSTQEQFLSPGERADVLVDFRNLEVGATVALVSLGFDPMHREMSHGSAGMHAEHGEGAGSTVPGSEYAVLKIVVASEEVYESTVPERLASLPSADHLPTRSRSFRLSASGDHGTMRWLINDASYRLDAEPLIAERGTVEVWEVHNDELSMPHPMHLHGAPFSMLSRSRSPGQVARLAVDEQGRLATDLGRKDTVLVWPGESVRIAVDFRHPFEGEQRYLFHCHILEHEDAGMMTEILVT